MQQPSLLQIHVKHEFDSTALFDGADLKCVVRGDDGRDYAAKRVQDGALIPISEWVGYHLWRACGLLTPDFAVLYYEDDSPPAFGSQIELLGQQIKKDPDTYTIAGFFGPHLPALSLSYPLDAFYINPDRHGRNFIKRPTLTAPELLCFDYSRAWAADRPPCGNEASMHACNSAAWWSFFVQHMHARADTAALEAATQLDAQWLRAVLDKAPQEWRAQFDAPAALNFWHHQRTARAAFARRWAQCQ